jgi:hypothetical protein
MRKTQHAQERIQQRGKSETDIWLIRKYGKRKGDGFVLTRRDAAKAAKRLRRDVTAGSADAHDNCRILQRLEHLVGWRLVVCDEAIITIYPTLRRVYSPRRRRRPRR